MQQMPDDFFFNLVEFSAQQLYIQSWKWFLDGFALL